MYFKAFLEYNTDTYNCSMFNLKGNIMWTKPTATDMRFGFEITMYIANR
jgi:coenzyme PQQ precursor peptide PqqA